ncbi:MAG TPA: hypothetical protein VFZ01_07650 [Geminicoccaceae bacterium]
MILLHGLRAAHDPAVGIEALLGRRDPVEIELGVNLGAHPVEPERARQQFLDGALEAGLVGQAELLALARDEAPLVDRAAAHAGCRDRRPA